MDSSIRDKFLFSFSINKTSSSFDHDDDCTECPENEPLLNLYNADDDDAVEVCGRSIKV